MKTKMFASLVLMSFLAAPPFVNAQDWALSAKERAEENKATIEKRAETFTEKKGEREANLTERSHQSRERVCENGDEIFARVMERQAQYQNRWKEMMGNFETKQSERADKLRSARSEADTKRSTIYNSMMEKSETDEQKAAIEKFRSSVEQAVTDRRTSIDTDIDTFQSGVRRVIHDHETTLSALWTNLENSIASAARAVEEACDEGLDIAEAKRLQREEIAEAKKAFIAGREEIGSMRDDIKPLREALDVSVEAAFDTFHSAVTAAKEDLQRALGREIL